MNTTNKKSLVFRFGLTLAVGILALMSVLAFVCLKLVNSSIQKNYITSTTELVQAQVQGLAYRNSKFMQQLRMYTTAEILSETDDTAEIAEWLRSKEKVRSKDFSEIFYCDLSTGIAYTDAGRKFNANGNDYFEQMQSGLSQCISNPQGTNVSDAVYYVCKLHKSNKVPVGFFGGIIEHKTLEQAVTLITVGENGNAILVDGKGTIMAHQNDSLVMKANCFSSNSVSYLSEVATDLIAENSNFAWTKQSDGTKELVVYAPVKGTPWGLMIQVPEFQIKETEKKLSLALAILIVSVALILVTLSTLTLIIHLKPLKEVDKNIHEIASGNADLTQRLTVKTNDEIGSVTIGFNSFIEKLQAIMTDIKNSREDLSYAGNELHSDIDLNAISVAEILSNIKTVQAQISSQYGSVQETAGAVNEIASNIESLERMVEAQANGVDQASSAVEQMIGNISSVNSSVEKMASSFDILEQKAREGNEKQSEMNEKIEQIKIQSETLQEANAAISSIASQTNLLAMNAAIEAAHAGDAGKGFSVVADEIRKLSETSSLQSKTIGEQLGKIKDSIGTVVDTSQSNSQIFTALAESIRNTDQLVRQISGAMAEQQAGSKQIIDSLREMSNSSSEVKAASREMSEGNKQILNEVQNLQNATADMKTSVDSMGESASKIRNTGNALEDVSFKIKSSIEKISGQIDSFQV